MEDKIYDVLIIGSGPAGLTAGIYASRASLSPLLLAGEQWGGQLMWTTEVENFPGFPEGIQGAQLMNNMMEQAKRFGTEVKFENAIKVDLKSEIKTVETDKGKYKAKTVIISSGSSPRKLQIPGEDKFYGRGVSTCATCDGAFYKDKVVAVVGGGDSAMEEASFLTRFTSKVFVIHRKDEFRASAIMQERVKNDPKVEILWNTEVREVLGEEVVKGIKIWNNIENKESELQVDGLFLAIGHIPVTGYLKDEVELNDQGYVQPLTVGAVKTNLEGVFVAGEAQDFVYKQAITTAADGCKAALEAQKYLETKH